MNSADLSADLSDHLRQWHPMVLADLMTGPSAVVSVVGCDQGRDLDRATSLAVGSDSRVFGLGVRTGRGIVSPPSSVLAADFDA